MSSTFSPVNCENNNLFLLYDWFANIIRNLQHKSEGKCRSNIRLDRKVIIVTGLNTGTVESVLISYDSLTWTIIV